MPTAPRGPAAGDVVISSVAVLTSVADTVDGFTDALRHGRSGVRAVSLPDAAKVRVAAFLPAGRGDDNPVLGVERDARLRTLTNRCAPPARAAARVGWEAVLGAGLGTAELAGTAIVVGGNNLALGHQAQAAIRMECGDGRVLPSYVLTHLDTDVVGTVSELTGATAEGYTIGGASASGTLALIHGCRLLALDAADHCLVIGPLSELSTAEYRALHDSGALAAGEGVPSAAVCRPFDRHRAGFVHGHGAAAVVLERRDTARRRGASPWAAVAGYAQHLDGKRGTTPDPVGQAATIAAALASAGLGPGEVDYVNAHATGSVLGDRSEAEALAAVFGRARPLVNATKELTGHCLAGSGVIEAVATAVQLREGFCHPNPNLTEPADARLAYAGPKAVDAPLSVAISTSFAFSGINAAVVITALPGR
jgi:malonyl-ACP decarboxylase